MWARSGIAPNALRASSSRPPYLAILATASSVVPASCPCQAGSNDACSEAAAATGWRSRKTSRASGQHAVIRSQISTLLGVFTTIVGLPLRLSASASRWSQVMYSTSLTVTLSAFSEAWIHGVSACIRRCATCTSGGA